MQNRTLYFILCTMLVSFSLAAGPATAPSDKTAVGEHLSPEQIQRVDPPPKLDRRQICFVVDAGESMKPKLPALVDQLEKAVIGLRPIQYFNIVVFQEKGCLALNGGEMLPATPERKRKAMTLLENMTAAGKTDPLPGLDLAFALKPNIIYLLADHDFPDNDAVLKKIRKLNTDKKVRINTIAFVNAKDPDTGFIELLKTIAGDSNGTFKRATMEELKKPPATQPAGFGN